MDDAWYVDAAGVVDLRKLLAAFATFYGEHAEHWLRRFNEYGEAASQLILQAYLQRIVNGGGRIEREYGLGRGQHGPAWCCGRERPASPTTCGGAS